MKFSTFTNQLGLSFAVLFSAEENFTVERLQSMSNLRRPTTPSLTPASRTARSKDTSSRHAQERHDVGRCALELRGGSFITLHLT